MKNFTLLLVFYLTTFLAFAQTSLTAGDIAFLGVNTDGVEDADDSFAFVLLKDVDINTSIIFTDRGWNDGTGFVEPLAVGDGEFTWTTESALSAGEIVILNFSNLSPNAAAFTVLGDQLFAIQGTISSPVFIAGMHLNVSNDGSDDANWDGAATSNTTSALPDALTTRDTAIRFPIEQDNWQFSCVTGLCPLSGTAEEIRAVLHNPVNWVSDNTNVFPGTVDVNLGTITVGPVNTPPTITSLNTAIVEENQTLAIHVQASDDIDVEGPGLTYSLTGDGVDQLLFNIDEVTGEVTFMNAPDFENPEDEGGNNIYEFQVTVTDSGNLTTIQDISINVIDVDDTAPILVSTDPIDGAIDVAVDAILTVTFSEPIQFAAGGEIIIQNITTGTLFGTLEAASGAVTYSGNGFTIDPMAPFLTENEYEVQIDATDLEDVVGNPFAGIASGGWTFKVLNNSPIVTCPAHVNVNAGDSIDPSSTGVATATGGIGDVTITFADSSMQDGHLITRTWTARDTNGSVSSCDQIITIIFECEVAILQQPQDVDVTVCDIEPLGVFKVEASGLGTLSYVWEEKIASSCCTWSPLAVNENTLEIATEALAAANGSKFRVTVTSDNGTPGDNTDDCSVMSDEVTLTTVSFEPIADLPVNFGLQSNLGGGLPAQGTQVGDLGVYSGPGVIDDGNGLTFSWDPEVAGEGIKTITYTYTNENGCISTASDEILILPAAPLASVNDVIQLEGTGGTTSFVFEVSLNEPSTQPITVRYYTSDEFAISPDDYEAVEFGTLTFSPGETSKNININIVPDSEIEQDESFYVILSGVWFIDDFIVQGIILNDDKECEVIIEAEPMDVVVCEFEPYSWGVGATGNGALSYLWEVSIDNGQTWRNYPNAIESILNTPQGAIVGANGWLFRAIVTSDNGTPNDATDDCTTTSETARLTVNPLPVVEITGKDSYCNNGNGVVLDAGAGHSSYLWSPGGATTQTITTLEGSYTVEVANEFGCTKISEAFIVTNNQPLVCNILQDVLTTDHLTSDGVATVNITGGTGHYMYLWDNGETTQTATTLTYGMHSVTVTDSNGCETTCQIDIAKELYCWTNLVQNVSIYGGNDGAARVKGNGGYRPHTFKWGDGSTEQLNSNLGVGTHYVTITDSSGATSQCSVKITEPNKGNCNDFSTSIIQEKLTTDHVTMDGVATVYPKGGTGQYTYLWDNGETTPTATTITYGMHSVTVTDAAGCISIAQIDIAKELYCWINIYKNVSIHGAKDGSAMVHGNGGYRPHTFKWDDGSTEQLNSKLGAGTHYVTITDATGATSRCSVTIAGPNQEICDGIDNDGDGKIDEGFDQDGDGIADCFDICSQGDDLVDMDFDGIPDACDDNICVKGEKPMTECYQTAVWNIQTCSWDLIGEQPEKPMTECYQTAIWNDATCTWNILDEQPEMPVTECYQTAVWNVATCTWDILDEQPEMPMTECYQTAVWNVQTCSWDITGEQPEMPMTECYQTAIWNVATCTWDILDEQPEKPMTECYQTAEWNAQTCSWDLIGEQPEKPMTDCYQTAEWNAQSCSWEVTGEQPEMPETECNETAEWNAQTCNWDIIQNNNNCGSGTIDQCETAFARSTDEKVRTCFLDISGITANRWGWTNSIPSVNGSYELELYAAAGQCDITKGALVGNVVVVYENGLVDVTVSVLSGYKMTEAQLHVGGNPIPLKNNGSQTVAPGQYPYHDDVNGDFYTYTFENLNPGDMDNFYVILHANVCPSNTSGLKTTLPSIELMAYPIPFKEEINLKVMSPRIMNGKLFLYDGVGRIVQDFGMYNFIEGENELKLQIGELPIGMYFIHMESDYGNEMLKVIGK